MLEDAERAGVSASLCFLDIDGLKQVNDRFGHDAGDDFIRSFIDAIRASTRSSDILCRWGGDEFLLLLYDCSAEQAEKIMRKIAAEFERIREAEKRPYGHKFSYGIVVINPKYDGLDLGSFISAADILMYDNKKTRRENIHAAI
jgi:diguanylate cyclase (GGDEF)-like protein